MPEPLWLYRVKWKHQPDQWWYFISFERLAEKALLEYRELTGHEPTSHQVRVLELVAYDVRDCREVEDES